MGGLSAQLRNLKVFFFKDLTLFIHFLMTSEVVDPWIHGYMNISYKEQLVICDTERFEMYTNSTLVGQRQGSWRNKQYF